MKIEDIRLRGTFHVRALATIGIVVGMAGGCAGADPDVPTTESIGRAEEAATDKAVWTRFISEEDGQSDTSGAHCPSGMATIGFECNGDFCDNVRIRCDTFSGLLGGTRWTHWVEHSGTQAKCGTNEWMTAVRCWGDNCDNVAIECAASNNAPVGCSWTPDWYSEESGAYTTEPGRYIRGVECSGRHCDNKRYYVCATRPPAASSCVGNCGAGAGGGTCWCDDACLTYGDCCTDYERVCL